MAAMTDREVEEEKKIIIPKLFHGFSYEYFAEIAAIYEDSGFDRETASEMAIKEIRALFIKQKKEILKNDRIQNAVGNVTGAAVYPE